MRSGMCELPGCAGRRHLRVKNRLSWPWSVRFGGPRDLRVGADEAAPRVTVSAVLRVLTLSVPARPCQKGQPSAKRYGGVGSRPASDQEGESGDNGARNPDEKPAVMDVPRLAAHTSSVARGASPWS
jgi:hypothetical protein